MKTSLTLLASLLLLALPLTAQVLHDLESDTVYPGNVEWVDGKRQVLVNRVVDAETGLPIPGATMTIFGDEDFPVPGSKRIVGEATVDADGWVRLPGDLLVKGSCDWFVFDAPGYAPYGVHSYAGEYPMELQRGHDARIRVVDELGKPLPNVDLELLLGCGHDGASQSARSDAQGIAVFKEVVADIPTAELWVRGSGVRSRYHDWHSLVSRDEVRDLVVEPAADIRGRVLDHVGQPLVGAFVGVNNCKRGPWVKTDEQGRFLLTGLDNEEFSVHLPSSKGPHTEAAWVTRPALDIEVCVQVDVDGKLMLPVCDREFELFMPGLEAESLVYEIRMSRTEDGFAKSVKVEEDSTTIALPQTGSWIIEVFSDEAELILRRHLTAEELKLARFEFHSPALTKSETESEEVVDSEVAERPDGALTIPLRVSFLRNELHDVFLLAKNYEKNLTEPLRWIERQDADQDAEGVVRDCYGTDLYLGHLRDPEIQIRSRTESFGLGYGQEDNVQLVKRFPIPKGATEVTIKARVYVLQVPQLLSETGEEISCSWGFSDERFTESEIARHEQRFGSGLSGSFQKESPFTILKSWVLPHWLHITPSDESLGRIWVDLGVLDPQVSEHHLLTSAGSAATSTKRLPHDLGASPKIELEWPMFPGVRALMILIDFPDFQESFEIYEGENLELPRWTAQELMGRPMTVTVEMDRDSVDQVWPLKATLDPEQPMALCWPETELTLEIAGLKDYEWGQVRLWVTLDGEELSFPLESNLLRLHGLPPGLHRLILAAPGRKSHRIDFKLEQQLKIPVTMNPLDDD